MTTSQQPEVTGVPLSDKAGKIKVLALNGGGARGEPYRVCRRLYYLS